MKRTRENVGSTKSPTPEHKNESECSHLRYMAFSSGCESKTIVDQLMKSRIGLDCALLRRGAKQVAGHKHAFRQPTGERGRAGGE